MWEDKKTYKAINKDSGKVATFDSETARDAAIDKGTHSSVVTKKQKAKKKKFKAPKIKIPSFADLQKKKAEKNYFKTTSDTTDDTRFKFKFDIGEKEVEYNYNWPYDFCSLVELAKIDTEIEFKLKE